MKDVLTIGELLIDFIGGEGSLEETKTFEKCFGGAPGNLAIACSRLGLKVGIISRVGNDAFGRFLLDTLKREGVDTSYIEIDEKYKTGLAFVSHIKERQFLFYRGAEMFIKGREELDNFRYICFGSIPLITETSRRAVLKAIKIGKKIGAKICFDPNIRLNLWKEDTLDWVRKILEKVDLLLLTEEEGKMIFEERNLETLVENIRKKFELIGIKMGARGSMIIQGNKIVKMPAIRVKVIDTTGAGDAWNAGLLFSLINGYDLITSAKIANICGALCVSKKGAITALPRKNEVLRMLKKFR
ncbi:MAG: carbohydrate kinase [Candidatus Aenigmatarchaeota archaeon]|nr:carbohydrate kinase [Candidatus Aenigmarchaeota archaeon]